MARIAPAPAALGLASPVLGPWFGDATVTLPAPGQRLSVALTFTANTTWLPPTIGTLTLRVASSPRPPQLAGLTDALGAQAFTTGGLVALFQLLPEVEDRLEVLTGMLPRPDGVANPAPVPPAVRTRARVRSIAIEFANSAPSLLANFVNTLGTGSDPEAFGLITGSDGNLANGPLAMSDLRRPEKIPLVTVQPLANFTSGTSVTMWAFDAEGLPIDPGAVANWWLAIGGGSVAPFNGAPNIWADNANQRTCNVNTALVFRIVSPHRGVVDPAVGGRLTRPPANAAVINAANPDLFTRAAGPGATAVTFTNPPAQGPDTAPIPLAAMLPLGNYGNRVNLWAGGVLNVPVNGGGTPIALQRDYVEVAVADAELFLVGTPRTGQSPPVTPADRRAADQNRASTRINVTRTQVALLPTIDTVAAAFNGLPNAANSVSILTTAFDHDWGWIGLNLPGGGTLPNTLPPLTTFALEGGGEADGQTIGNQQIVIRLTLPSNNTPAGTWVRIYPQKIDLVTGRREAMPGGSGSFGTAAATGANTVAHVVVTLPEGRLDGSSQMGVDVVIVDGVNPPQVYADQRVTRPQPVGGSPVSFVNVPAGDLVLVCELGNEFASSGIPNGSIPSGSTLVARTPASGSAGERFRLISRSTIPLVWCDNNTVAKALTTNDVIAVTTPAFAAEMSGDTNPNNTASVVGLNAAVRLQGRNGITNLGTAGAPLPSQERLELVGLRNAGSAAGAQNVAVIGSAPALATWHEIPPIQAGNPNAPAAPEVHGAGVQLTGGAITDVADFMRDRLFPASNNLATDSGTNPLPAQAIAAPAQWAAVLKTVAKGVEGEPGLYEALDLADGAIFNGYDAIAAAIPTLPPVTAIQNANAALRAMSRRIVNALGRQEALFALTAAIARAERLIYVETPAIDAEVIDADGADVTWLTALIARLTAKPALRLALCVPRELLPGTPAPLKWVRSEVWHQALDRLLSTAGDRIAVFSPGAGPFSFARFASTVVVIDDVWAMVGNTHLWRRGLSFDSSVAVTVFDETNTFSRSTAISAFRIQLAADRLGLTATQIPLVSREFVESLQRLTAGGGAGRLALGSIPRAPAGDSPTESDLRLWNRDGSISGDADLGAWLTTIFQYVTNS